ncbi:hypothetical protein [Nocardia arizonensis]|uniref:hypothetical protein n=1 Tax=Nocardia arizonensis TaxID=1141647 RepID=UPI0006D2AC2D|nr:hypothetical protein [Nocardia arizonensis]
MSTASAGSGRRALAWNFGLRTGVLSGAARRELLLRGTAGVATILGVRRGAVGPGFPLPGAETFGRGEPGQVFWVRVRIEGELPYETRVRQRVRDADLEWVQPGDVVCCRVDPGDRHRLVLYLPDAEEAPRISVAKILANGRRADATVLAAAPVAGDYSGRDDPVLRLDLELRAWDEPKPWRVRVVQPVPLSAIGLVDLGRHLEVAFFAVDRGESVAVDWTASLGED